MSINKFSLFISCVLLLQYVESDDICPASEGTKQDPYCCNGQIRSQIISSNSNNGTCFFNYRIQLTKPDCQSKPNSIGECQKEQNGKFYCMAEDTLYTAEVDDKCKCINNPVKRLRICCCKEPEKYVTCEKATGVLTTVNIRYTLINDVESSYCETNERRKSIKIRFETQYLTTEGPCMKDGIRRNTITKRYLDGCEIKEIFARYQTIPCACSKLERTETSCVLDVTLVTKVFKSELDCCGCRGICTCKEKLISEKKETIGCPETIKTRSECVYPSAKRFLTITSYTSKNCKCEKYKEEICEFCPVCTKTVNNETFGECCKCSGLQTVTMHFIDIDCKNKTQTYTQICACVDSPPPTKTFCDNGISYTISYFYKFDDKNKVCIKESVKKENIIQCNARVETKEVCGKTEQYFEFQTITEYIINKKTCLCEPKVEKKKLICKCQPKKESEWKCENNDNTVRSVITYQMNKENNKCDERIDKENIKVICSIKDKTKTIKKHRCLDIIKIFSVYVEDCKCKYKITREKVVKCCLESPTENVTCSNGNLREITSTTYKIRCDKQECEPIVLKSKKIISCETYLKESKTPCINGEYLIIKKHFAVKDCQCVKTKVDRIPIKIKCNVNTPLTTSTCKGDHRVITTTTWRMNNCECVSCSKSVQQPIKCEEPVRKKGPCNRSTGFVSVRVTTYKSIHCKCVPEISHFKVPCPCLRPDRLEKAECVGNKRIVNQLRYESIGIQCHWVVISTESEDCECCKERSVTVCQSHKLLLTTITSYVPKLVKLSFAVMRCFKETNSKTKKILCDKPYTYLTPCKHNQQRVISCSYDKINCKCNKKCEVDCVRACNCYEKNKSIEKCINNIKYKINYQYNDNGEGCGCGCKKKVSKCAESISKITLQVNCEPPLKKEESTPCYLQENNGYYKQITIYGVTKENCICRDTEKKIKKLCRCREDYTAEPYCKDNKLIVIKTIFTRKGNKCILQQSESLKPIYCPKPYIIVNDYRCSTEYVLVFNIIQNCKCVQRRTKKSNDKCCYQKSPEKKCVNSQWEITEHSYIQKETNCKLFRLFNKSPIETICEQIKKKSTTPIVCRGESREEWCDTKTKIFHIKITYQVNENCKCITKIRKIEKPCTKCKDDEKHFGPCGPSGPDELGYMDITTTSYQVTRGNTCKKFVTHQKEICRCKNPKDRSYCKNGNLVSEKIHYTLTSHPRCQQQVCLKHKSIYCYNNGKSNTWKLTKTEKCEKPGEYTIDFYEREQFDSNKCECIKKRKQIKREICCKPCTYQRMCVKNNLLHVKTCFYPKGLKCIATKTNKKISIECPCSTKVPIGKEENCTQNYSLKEYTITNCKCQSKITKKSELVCCIPKRTVNKSCEGKRWRITTTIYHLSLQKCIPRRRITFEDICTCSLHIVHYKDTRLDDCYFERSYFNKKIVNCKYEDNFIRKEKLVKKVTCCKPPKTVITCKKNRIVVETKQYYVLSNFHCLRRTSIKEKQIDCSYLDLEKRISTGKCHVKDIFYKIVYTNCKCKQVVIKEENKKICCWDEIPYSKKNCDPIKGIVTTSHFTFYLKDYKCLPCERKTSVKVHCDRKECHRTVGPCVKNNNLVKTICSQRVKCKCIKTTKVENQCCKPESYEWSEVGDCDKKTTCLRKTKYYSFRINKSNNLCEPVLRREIERKCCCRPKLQIQKSCIRDNYKKLVRITYKLNKELDSCIRTVSQQILPIGCDRKKKKLRIVSNICNSETGISQRETEYVQAIDCKCVKTRQTKPCICLCAKAYPTQSRTFCRNNKVLVNEIKTAVCCKCHSLSWKVDYEINPIKNCEKIVTERGNCFEAQDGYAVSIRFLTRIQYVLIDCKCIRKEINKKKEHCRCRKTYTTVKCEISRKLITTHLFSMKNGICQKSKTTEVENIPCPSKPQIEHSKCENNKYIIKTLTFYHRNCKCLHNKHIRTCDCKCPENTIRQECSKNFMINVIKTTWTMKDCRCSKEVKITQIPPKCPDFVKKSVSKCIKKGDSGFKTITTRRLSNNPDLCKCEVIEKIKKKICWCKENTGTIKFCKNNNEWMVETWSDLINIEKNQCRREKSLCACNTLSCPPKTVKYECNQKTGRDVETTTICKIINCKPHRTINKSYGRCKCSKKWKLISEGKCLEDDSCLRTDIYERKELRNRECIRIKEIKTVKCCCKPRLEVKEFCENNNLYKSTTVFTLINQLCIPARKDELVPKKCNETTIVKEGKCNYNGDKIIKKYRYFIKKCKCVLKKVEEYTCKCRCCKDNVQYHCNADIKVQTKTVTKYFITQCKCMAKTDLIKIPINCPKSERIITKCIQVNGKNYSIRKRTIVDYIVNEKCKCSPKSRIKVWKCFCERNENENQICDKIKNVIIFTKTYTILLKNECVIKTETKRNIPCCGSGKWALKGDSGCVENCKYGTRLLTYVKQIVVGCRCKELIKTKRCDCICSGPATETVCCGTKIKHIFFSYKLVKCKCVVKERVEWEILKCASKSVIKIPWKKDLDGICREHIKYTFGKIEQCRCKITEKTETNTCKCDQSFIVRKCNKTNNTIIEKETRYQALPTGCIKNIKTTILDVPCNTMPDCKVIKRCARRQRVEQTHECIMRKLENCRCNEYKVLKTYPCWCKNPRIHRGECNRETCFRVIKTSIFNIVIGRHNENTCKIKISNKKEKCCCLEKNTKVQECKNNKLIVTTVTYNFDEIRKICCKNITTVDETPPCSPAKSEHPGECHQPWPPCTQRIYVTLKSLEQCKCVTTKRSFLLKCCCPKNKIVKACTSDNKVRLDEIQYTLAPDRKRCNKTITTTYKNVCCSPKTSRYLNACNQETLKQTKEVTFYRIKNCSCQKIVKRIEETCDCRKPSTKEVCIADSGITRRTITTLNFNKIKHECIPSSEVTDKPTCCDSKPRTNCGRCRISYKCGIYKRCKMFTMKRYACECKYDSEIHMKLCHCPKPTKYVTCEKNNKEITREISYNRVKSNNQQYDYICVKKTKLIKSKLICCPKSSICSGSCINDIQIYTKTYYITINCHCIMKTKAYKVTCKCPEPKEQKRVCLSDVQQVITTRNYKLVCKEGPIPSCRCVQFDIVNKQFVLCSKTYYKVGECVDEKRKITINKFQSKDCKCVKSTRFIFATCECENESPDCKQLQKMGFCEKTLYRQFLCQFTCGFCEICKPCSSKIIGQCKCEKVGEVRVCSRDVQVTKYKIINRKCVEQISVQKSLCGCSLDYSRRKCESFKKEGKCKEVEIRKRCEFICRDVCQLCQGTFKRKICVSSGKHIRTWRNVEITFNKDCNTCLLQTKVTYTGTCEPCKIHQRVYVTDCAHNVRFVVKNYVNRYTCVNKVIRTAYSCKECCTGTEIKIGDCKNGVRTVVTVFWANVNNSCKKQNVINRYSCNRRCNKIDIIRSKCLNNTEVVVKVWKSGKNCYSHSFSELKSCIPILT